MNREFKDNQETSFIVVIFNRANDQIKYTQVTLLGNKQSTFKDIKVI